MTETLFDDIVRLQRLDHSHAVDLLEAVLVSRAQITEWIGAQSAPATPEAMRDFVADWKAGWDQGTKYGFVARDVRSDRVVGFGLLNYIHDRYRIANLGYWVRSDESGRGLGSAITRLVSEFGFGQLGLVRIELVIEANNNASRRLAEKVGAMEEGLLRNRLTINGEVRDALMYSLVRT